MTQGILFDFGTTSETQSPQSSGNSASGLRGPTTIQSSLAIAATGLGKTAIMAGLARNWPSKRILLMSHRFELNTQAIAEFERVCQEPVAFEQASYKSDERHKHRIVVASVQSLNSKRKGAHRMGRFKPQDFGLLLIDEAHHAAAISYRRVIDYFRGGNPDIRLVGVTATPDRSDDIALGGLIFEGVGCDLNIQWGIANGWLVAPRQRYVKIEGLDLRDIRTRAGDLDPAQLAAIVEQERNMHAMAKPIVDVCNGRQAIIFCASVRQSRRLAELLRDYHARVTGENNADVARSIDGSISPQDPRRQALVADYRAGRILYLCNCAVATEGFDAPNAAVIANARPTKSRSLYTQMIGRGLRTLPGLVDELDNAGERLAAIEASDKPVCDVLDFIGQAGRHSLIHSTDIFAGEGDPDEILPRADQIIGAGNFNGDTLAALQEAREQLAVEEEQRRNRVTVGVSYELQDVRNIYDMAQIPPPASEPWYLRTRGVTKKQRSMLVRLGYRRTQIDNMSTRAGSAAIDYAIKNPRTEFGRFMQTIKRDKES